MAISGKWIRSPQATDLAAVSFEKDFALAKPVKKAVLKATAMGVYVPTLNGKRVGDSVLMPGWTAYEHRVLFQTYDVTALLREKNTLALGVGVGWAVGIKGKNWHHHNRYTDHTSLLAALTVTYADGSTQTVATDETWRVYTTAVTMNDFYLGETQDYTARRRCLGAAVLSDVKTRVVAQTGAWIREQDVVKPVAVLKTPKNEWVVDFGQNLAGYVRLHLVGKKGDRVVLHHGEVLDADGNFYNENYRAAESRVTYVLDGKERDLAPLYTFQGFRYVRLTEYPFDTVDPDAFTAVAVHSDMARTGDFVCGNQKVNQLYHNIIWGQKGNYLDIPTDCPQRDERLGWTGDTQVFCRTGAINFDVERFFTKWMEDVALEQEKNGAVGCVIPHLDGAKNPSAAWADAACVVPYELYRAYGNKKLLKKHFPVMKKWVDYMHRAGDAEFLWLGGTHFGDWLAMDNGEDNFSGATSKDYIASAYFAYSTALLVKAGKALGMDMQAYETLHDNVVAAVRARYFRDGRTDMTVDGDEWKPETQTGYVLALHFELCDEKDRAAFAARLAALVEENGGRMTTGFVGTPYLLHALSENGGTDLAYSLLLQEKTPSWLYAVNHGATTVWEHWNSQKEDGSFWSTDMNSFNHYAYGAVFDWIFGVAAGIAPLTAGYETTRVAPHPDRRLGFAKTAIETRHGRLSVHWYYRDERVVYELTVPAAMTVEFVLPSGKTHMLTKGSWLFAE